MNHRLLIISVPLKYNLFFDIEGMLLVMPILMNQKNLTVCLTTHFSFTLIAPSSPSPR
jgi:hypothetical protein